jgi:hypothetical protein
MVVSSEQQGIPTKLNASFNPENFVFYSFDRATNTVMRIARIDYRIENGYIRFMTEMGGDIVISDDVLARR